MSAPAVALAHTPKACDLRDHLGVVGASLHAAMAALAADPTPARAGMVGIQLAGAQQLVAHFREALLREGGANVR